MSCLPAQRHPLSRPSPLGIPPAWRLPLQRRLQSASRLRHLPVAHRPEALLVIRDHWRQFDATIFIPGAVGAGALFFKALAIDDAALLNELDEERLALR